MTKKPRETSRRPWMLARSRILIYKPNRILMKNNSNSGESHKPLITILIHTCLMK